MVNNDRGALWAGAQPLRPHPIVKSLRAGCRDVAIVPVGL
jgi:hypothetical protein